MATKYVLTAHIDSADGHGVALHAITRALRGAGVKVRAATLTGVPRQSPDTKLRRIAELVDADDTTQLASRIRKIISE